MRTRIIAWLMAAAAVAVVAAAIVLLRPRPDAASPQAAPNLSAVATPAPSPATQSPSAAPDDTPGPGPVRPTPEQPLDDVVSGYLETGDLAAAERACARAGKALLLQAGSPGPVRDGARVVAAVTDPALAACADKLNSDDAAQRADALQQLFYLSLGTDTRAEPVFVAMLARDPDEQVRASAAAGLELTESPSTVDLLIRALSDPAHTVREQARTTLGLIREDQVVEKLKAALASERDPAVREIIDQLLVQSFDQPLTIDPALLEP